MRSVRLRPGRLLLAGVLLLAIGACAGLPERGPVHALTDPAGDARPPAPYFAPPGPHPGDSAEGVVRGFLLAMQANPPSTAVARSFLTERARATWRPGDATVVYDTAGVVAGEADNRVTLRLEHAHRLDRRGAWPAPGPGATENAELALVREDGEWRIADPADALLVPLGYFSSVFAPFDLFFPDDLGSTLIPERVYLARGGQTATNLVDGLVSGPGAALRQVASTAFPSDVRFEPPVVVTDTGLAEITLSADIQRLSPATLDQVAAQLAWTLRQVPEIKRIRIVADGAPLLLPDGRSEIGVGAGAALDPVAVAERRPVAILPDGPARLTGDSAEPLDETLRGLRPAPRSMAWDESSEVAVVVTRNGRQALAAGKGYRSPKTLLIGADLARPVIDRYGDVWLLDRSAGGVRLSVVHDGAVSSVALSLPTAVEVTGMTVTRDGARLVLAARRGGLPVLLVAMVSRGRDEPPRITHQKVRTVPVDAVGRIVDLGQLGAATAAVLLRDDTGERILGVELDGSPGDSGTRPLDVPDGNVVEMIAVPDPKVPVRVLVEPGIVMELDPTGHWRSIGPADVMGLAAIG